MYPTLRTDARSRTWIDTTVATLAAFGEEHRARLDAANRAGEFPRDLYAEFGKLGFLGPLVPTEQGASAAAWPSTW